MTVCLDIHRFVFRGCGK